MGQAILAIVIVALTSGCVLAKRTQNEPLQAKAIARLEPGKTSARETVEWLGAPTEVVQLGRRSAYRYDHTRTKDTGVFLVVLGLYNSDTRADRAWVFFDENDVLTHVASSLRAKQASHALPWYEVRGEESKQ